MVVLFILLKLSSKIGTAGTISSICIGLLLGNFNYIRLSRISMQTNYQTSKLSSKEGVRHI